LKRSYKVDICCLRGYFFIYFFNGNSVHLAFLISPSQIARIIGETHRHPGPGHFLHLLSLSASERARLHFLKFCLRGRLVSSSFIHQVIC
jgi:hypothetical protein